MECKVISWDGREYVLPTRTEWRFSYGDGSPCDSFWVKCLWQGGNQPALEQLTRFYANEGGTRRFTGVVDEYSVTQTEAGTFLELSGRGMAALLLDNEAEAGQYQTATADDLLQGHVTPYGITAVGAGALPAVNGFTVASGSSEWQVVYDFACYHGGVTPRFDPWGRLILNGQSAAGDRLLDEHVSVTGMEYRGKRYGVLSQVLVRDKVRQTVERVTAGEFSAQGGQCRRVITMPGRSSYQAMRYSGEFQLKQSAKERRVLCVTVPATFFAQVGQQVTVRRKDWGCDGVYRVTGLETGCNGAGEYSKVTMGQ